ncbi:MAG: hypothetical protein ACRD10_08820 [Terriglobia bacterium]
MDPIDPLGDIELSDSVGSIRREYTYLDSWLSGLIKALKQVQSDDHAMVEVAEEPNPLCLERKPDGRIIISDGARTVAADDSGNFSRALRQASTAFLARISDLPNQERNYILDPIRRFAAEPGFDNLRPNH